MLCLHGRTRDQNKQLVGEADWDGIAEVVRQVDVPLIANGGIQNADDIDRCLRHTGGDRLHTHAHCIKLGWPTLICHVHGTVAQHASCFMPYAMMALVK